ncbi:hypothetical protein CkaCkLH20_08246 [Colletotrichum karsti]|uniref:Uncharacterized protein n=1 Tax=Colletotrichum karsti TaxID=1095194 RepID=A0A9P6I0L3_9PEZI|nr:uncharacterized protein CkaCkLH20_08246 [Colletotrichum karsti]KAF9874263.1 hypothetical protein CkaCkLH20_08246 [Colletotrichum karsti]
MGRPAKKRLSQDNVNAAAAAAAAPSSGYRRASTMSSTTIQSTQSDMVPTPTNEANEFQYGLGIIQSHPAEDATWVESFEDPLLGLLQHNDHKMVAAEWMEHDSLGFLDHHEEAVIPETHALPLTPPTTIGSLPNGSDDAWMQSCEQPHDFGHPESFACDTLPSSPEPKSTEPATQRLLDLQSRLFARHMAKIQEIDGLSALINTTVHSTETLIEIVEGLPQLRPSVEGRRSTSPLSSWGAGSDPAGFNAPAATYTASDPQLQQNPNYAITISLFITCYLVLLDSYDELLSALRARLQCSRQSQGPSPTSDMGLAQPFFNNAQGGNINKFNLVSSFDLDVNSVVFLLSRMMKRLHKSTESRFVAVSIENPAFNHMMGQNQGGGYPVRHGSISYDFQDGASQDTDGVSEPSSGGSLSPMMMMGNYALREVSQRHQSVMESLRVIRWLADEL